ncbi:MAG: adenylate/guanylate cyclase domain-containing protein, partial [Bacteroidota bacterium]
IVDDKEYNLKGYKLALEDAAIASKIHLANNENEAKQILCSSNPIDVIITDLMMVNETGGMEVLIAAKEKDPLLMVIIVTAYEKKLDRYKAFDLGAFECLEKGTPGVKTEQEIVVKTKNALRFREATLNLIESNKKIDFLRKYFDPRVFTTIEGNPDLLTPKMRIVSIVFWDIRGFSLLSEILKAHPDLVAGFLKEYFEVASDVIFEYNGVLDKFIGDGVMALFGALNGKDKEGKQDAVNAINAALKLRLEFEKIYKKWFAQWTLYTPQAIDIGIGCGIHTGEVLVGNMGTEIRDHFTAVGPHVNFASRIESKSEKGQIRISSSTRARIDGHFSVELVDTLTDIKNIPGKFEIFAINPG